MLGNDFLEMFNTIDTLFNSRVRTTNYPPYNIRKYTENDKVYVVFEFALAGFTKEEINVEIDNGKLIVDAKKEGKPEGEYIVKNIGTREFVWYYPLPKNVVIPDDEMVCKYKDGILEIELEIARNRKVLMLK